MRIASSPDKGRGVYATKSYQAGDIIEVAGVLLLTRDELRFLGHSRLTDYLFQWQGESAVVFGVGSLFNHSYTPNVVVKEDFENMTLSFIAYRDIAEGEEFCHNYTGNPTGKAKLWFTPR